MSSTPSKRLQRKQNDVPEVICPTCKKKGDWFTGAHGPFCSRRCQLIDLGKWFGGQHVISEPLRSQHFEKPAGPPPDEYRDMPKGG